MMKRHVSTTPVVVTTNTQSTAKKEVLTASIAAAQTPSKDDVRPRRLFTASPKNQQLPCSIHQSLFAPLKNKHKSSKRWVKRMACIGTIFLVSVHLYLFRAVITVGRSRELSESHLHASAVEDYAAVHSLNEMAEMNPPTQLRKNHHDNSKPHDARDASSTPLTPLRPIDYDQYTIRINTWRRNDQLLLSLRHHSQCPGVAQIQVVWCDDENEPPMELTRSSTDPNDGSEWDHSKVVIERHDVNTLNERFNILLPAPTLGILSIDDDVLRPCEALDAGFFKWTQHYDRMIGFDARMHASNPTHDTAATVDATTKGSWQYGYLSTTEKLNTYTLSLTRYCFVHRDYMDMYMAKLPSTILETVAKNFNCEDIAMSFLISSKTNGKPSMLVDYWAIKSLLKLYVEKKISGGSDHKHLRDECVDSFAEQLGLKEDGSHPLKAATFVHKQGHFFNCGDSDTPIEQTVPKSEHQIEYEKLRHSWHHLSGEKFVNVVSKMVSHAGARAFQEGFIENSPPWQQRFQSEKE